MISFVICWCSTHSFSFGTCVFVSVDISVGLIRRARGKLSITTTTLLVDVFDGWSGDLGRAKSFDDIVTELSNFSDDVVLIPWEGQWIV